MIKKLISLILSTALFVPISGFAQMNNGMDVLGNLAQTIGNNQNNDNDEDLNPDDDQRDPRIFIKEREKDFDLAEGFGYQGRDEFLTAPQPKKSMKPMRYFGYDFFSQATRLYDPSKNNLVPENYVLGTNDNIRIILFGNRNEKYSLIVNKEGSIFIPEFGPLFVSGLKFSELKNTIQSVISDQFLGTQVSVTLGELRSIDVFLLGEVFEPGLYSVSSVSTLTNALMMGGGVKTTGSLRNIQLKREGKVISSLDFYNFLLNGDTSNDAFLKQGDVIFIPPVKNRVGISGEVLRPGVYELADNESLKDLVSFSGGYSSKADFSSAELSRVNMGSSGFDLKNLDLTSKINQSTVLMNGDVIHVYPVLETMRNAILVSGHAQKPGFIPWTEGMRVSDIFKSKEDLLPMTDMDYMLIKRNSSFGSPEIIQLSISSLFGSEGESFDVELNNRDELTLFPEMLSLDLVKARLIDEDSLSESQKNKIYEEYTTSNQTENITPSNEYNIGNQSITKTKNELIFSDDFDATKLKNNMFYEYMVYDYCILPQDLGRNIVEKGIFSNILAGQSLDEITEFQMMEESKDITSEIMLTDICRRQLLKPIISSIKRNVDPNQSSYIVSVIGNIFFPGNYPLSENMSIKDLVNGAGGFKDGTYVSDIELVRNNISDKEFSAVTIRENSSVDLMQTKLQSSDILNIKKIFKDVKSVSVTGEVYFPGDYPIAKDESLRNLLLRSGGLKDNAFPKAAVYTRAKLRDEEQNRLLLAQNELKRKLLIASQTQGIGEQSFDANYLEQLNNLLENNSANSAAGRLVINLSGILDGSEDDIILEDGDELFIPKEQKIVSVIGEVFAPNAHILNGNNSINNYIDLSGGVTEFADLSNRYIIKADGSIISSNEISSGFFRSNTDLESGDTIVVPLKVDTFSGLKATTEITQIVYQMAIAAAAVKSF